MRTPIFMKKDPELDVVTFYDGDEFIYDRCSEAEVFSTMAQLKTEWPAAYFILEVEE